MEKKTQREKQLKRGHSLVKLPGKDNWYVDQSDGNLVYRKSINKRPVKIYTAFQKDQLKQAQKFVDQELIKKFSSDPVKAQRKADGIANPSVKELYDECVNERQSKKAKSTNLNYSIAWEHGLEPFWGTKTLADINQPNIIKYENWYVKNLPDRTFFNTRKCLIMLTNYLWNNGYFKNSDTVTRRLTVTKLDTEVLDHQRKKKKAGRRYTDAETKALLTNAVNLKTLVCIKIYRFMGPRKMELLSAKRSQLDSVNRTFEFYSTKNKKWRTVPIPDVVYDDLMSYIEETKSVNSEFLFPGLTNPNVHITSQVFDDDWTETKKRANIKGWNVKGAARVHDLRHSIATDMAEQGWPIRVACDILDMSTTEFERTYSDHISKDIKTSLMKRGFAKWV